jgi:sigma-B regulation protein RsbU (phosphoserine phosphatase)
VSPVLSISLDGAPARTVRLGQPVTTIGRSVDNVLEVPDPNMSRRHCVVEVRETGEVVLTDCNSSNGTRVNGERVVSQELRPGDEIECGSTRMRFATSEAALAAEPPRPPSAETIIDGALAATQMKLPPAVPVAPSPPSGTQRRPKGAKAEAALLAHERDDLRKLLEITKRLNQVHDLRRLLETIIDAAIELLAAERGFLILVPDGQLKIEIARDNGEQTILDPTALVSTQVCRQVLEGRAAVLTTNAQQDDRFGRYKSVVGLNLRSILCVPFRIKSEIFGVVYLDAAQVGAFSERDTELLEAFSDQAALAIENARLFKADRQRERMDQELRIASQIQKKLLPRELPNIPGLDACGSMHAAKEVGGDYYDFVPTADGNGLFVCIGDVSGKGVPAGLVMASARSAMRTLIERTDSTREIVLSLNRLLVEDLDQEMFLSFVLMRFDAPSGRIDFTGAGHEHIVIWREATRTIETRRTGGMVLGLSRDMDKEFKEECLTLALGDAVLLYTDGVTEGINEQREQYGLERLIDAATRFGHLSARVCLQSILSEVLRWKGRASQRDDISLVVLKRVDPSVKSAQVEAARAGELLRGEETRARAGGEPTNVHGLFVDSLVDPPGSGSLG